MDRDLIERARQGDRDAFTAIATATYARLHRVAQNIVSDQHLAEDAMQQAVLEMWRHLPQLREPEKFDAWAYRIVVNACRREGRRSSRWKQAFTVVADDDPTALASFSAVAHRDQLERGFRRLSREQREVVVLHHYARLPLREVADVLGIATGTAHSRHDRAMRALRSALEADERLPEPNAPSPGGPR